MRDLIIIGGGAAALSATAFALEKQLKTRMIYETLGGQSHQPFHVREYGHYGQNQPPGDSQLAQQPFAGESALGGEQWVQHFEETILRQPDVAIQDSVIDVSRVGQFFQVRTAQRGTHQCQALIIATGVTPQVLEVPGIREFLNRGLSYSATTHAHLLAGKRVAIIGTTMRALRASVELARTAERVSFVQPEPAGPIDFLVNALRRHPNVEVFDGYRVVAVRGNATVEQVIIEQQEHRRVVDIDALFIDIGIQPNSQVVRHLVQTDRAGFIWVNERNATSQPGLFAAGDVTTSFAEQMLIAIGDGVRAASSAYDYLLARPVEHVRAIMV